MIEVLKIKLIPIYTFDEASNNQISCLETSGQLSFNNSPYSTSDRISIKPTECNNTIYLFGKKETK